MEKNQQKTTPKTSLPKETELPENTDYRGIAGNRSLTSDQNAPEQSPPSGKEDNNNETADNPLIRGI